MASRDKSRLEARAIRQAAMKRLEENANITFPHGISTKTLRIEKEICKWMGWPTEADPLDTLRAYLESSAAPKSKAPEPYIGKVAPSSDIAPKARLPMSMSLAMRIAAERASVQPPMIAMVSKVDNWREIIPADGRRR